MVAVLLLSVGVLATLGMVDGANRTTGVTRSRESATALTRSVVEAARAVPDAQLSTASAPAVIQTEPGLADSNASLPGWQVTRRGITYTISFTACNVDDPADGTGTDDSSFCSAGTPTNPPDQQPADYKRVSATTTWQDQGGPHTTTQSTIVSSTYRGPSVTSLSQPSGVFTSSANPGSIAFTATTTSGTNHVTWSLDGNAQGPATGGGTSWGFTWSLGEPTGSPPCNPSGTGVLDGTYIVRADAYDKQGLHGAGQAVTVQINRCPPLAPTGLEGGEAKLWPGVELQWDKSPEEDVVGYYVYTGPTSTGPWTPAPANVNPDPSQPDCSGLLTTANCVDEDTVQKLYYFVQAVDKDPSTGAYRTSSYSAPLLVDPANKAPGKPGVQVNGAFAYSLQWGGQNIPSPPPADYTDFFYIYRDTANGRVDRYDSIENIGPTVQWTDPDPGGVPHKYWVTAVDNHLAESPLAPTPPAHYISCDASGVCKAV